MSLYEGSYKLGGHGSFREGHGSFREGACVFPRAGVGKLKLKLKLNLYEAYMKLI